MELSAGFEAGLWTWLSVGFLNSCSGRETAIWSNPEETRDQDSPVLKGMTGVQRTPSRVSLRFLASTGTLVIGTSLSMTEDTED